MASPPSDSTPPPAKDSSSPPTDSSPPQPSSPPPTDSSPPPPPQNSPPPSSPPPTAAESPPATPASDPPPAFSPPPPSSASQKPRPPPAVLKPSPPPSEPSNNNHRAPSRQRHSVSDTDIAIITGIIGGGIVVLVLMFICLLYMRRKKKQEFDLEHGFPPKGGDPHYKEPIQKKSNQTIDPNSNESSPNSANKSPNVGGYGPKSPFTYDELTAATSGFSEANLLGQGGFGNVHKGVLPNGKEVAVKSLKAGSGQGEREFQAEVEIISRVHHRYLVSLVGYCIAGKQRMLVYEFVANKTLEFHLHSKDQPVMDWASRLRIAVGSAKGLAYLHEDCHPRIIHRDIKSANILLDSNYEAKVADFGLAKLSNDSLTHVSTRVMGTFGYLAPEYAASGKLTDKSDVFSFGVMLLEIITGRRPVDPTSNVMGSLSLVDWARPLAAKALESGNYSEMVDRRLEDNYVPHEMARMIASASACIRHSSRKRPRMRQIVRALVGDVSLEDLNEGQLGERQALNASGNPVGTYDTGACKSDMMKFQKMVMTSQNSNSNRATSEYGNDSDDTEASPEAASHRNRKR